MKISVTHLKKMLPFAVLAFFGSISVILWLDQKNHKRELILKYTESSAEQIRIRIEGMMSARIASLNLLAERWVERRPPDFSRQRFLQFAGALYANYPGFTRINWVGPDGVIRWVFQKERNVNIKGKSIYEHSDRRVHKAFEKARENLRYAVTPCVELFKGGLGFCLFWPLIYDDNIQGYLNGVFQVKLIVDTCLAKNIFNEFWVRLYEADRLIYTNEKSLDRTTRKERSQVLREIHFPGKSWHLALEPRHSIYLPAGFRHLTFLIFGLIISAGISLVLYFLLQRMQMYREARDYAFHEVSERKRAEEALKKNEKRLQALLTELDAKNAELETFVYSVSHDLKTPIVTIEGFIGAFREDFGGRLTEESDKYLNYITDATRKMELLIM